jgi:CRP-like cAMP-binding protein
MEESEKVLEPLLDVESIIPILNRISLFGGLDEKELYIIFRNLKRVRYRTDELIVRQGTPANYIYIVKSGRVRVYIEEKQRALELTEFGVGNCFGEASLIGIQPHSANVIALEDTELMVLSGKDLHSFYQTDTVLFSKIIMNIARDTCRRLYRTDNTLLHYVLGEEESKT